jgi:hypothetical protein
MTCKYVLSAMPAQCEGVIITISSVAAGSSSSTWLTRHGRPDLQSPETRESIVPRATVLIPKIRNRICNLGWLSGLAPLPIHRPPRPYH